MSCSFKNKKQKNLRRLGLPLLHRLWSLLSFQMYITVYPSPPTLEIQILVSSLTITVIPIFVTLISSLLPLFDSPQLQSLLRVNVSQVQVDECVRTDCKTSGGCSTQLSISDSPTLVDSGALSLVSVTLTSSAVCGCAAREMTHQPCSSYPSNPCLNGGTCVDTQNGYRWEACLRLLEEALKR